MKIEYVWYFLTFLTLLSALMTILVKNPVHSVLYLILTFFMLSAHYVLLNAQFLAIVNIAVYAGAIMVLFLFVIMFINLRENNDEQKSNLIKISAAILGGILLILFIGVFKTSITTVDSLGFKSQTGMVENLGKVLFRDYLLPFELVTVLFFVAMVGAVMLAKREAGERNF
jgi:NADH-quinone oxidoreductase subunit J